MNQKRETWSSRATFIMAAIGSAVGLGNAWRFPGLAAKYGGGAFLLVYILAMLVLGIPMLAMEISIGRKTKQGAPGAMRALNKKAEPIGWLATSNAFAITTYYSVVFAWVILMAVFSFKFAAFTGTADGVANAKGLFLNITEVTGTTPTGLADWAISPKVFAALIVAWIAIYLCIRKGTASVGKVVKYTGLFLPLLFLGIMAVKGLTLPGSMTGLAKLFTPDFTSVINSGNLASLVVDAIGQVFYSLSIMMAIMFAYGSYLDEGSNIAVDAVIIAFSDLFVSVLSGVVMFTTLYGLNMQDNFTASGIVTAFFVYPQAIVSLTNVGWINAAFGLVFYLCLCSLAIDSAFSIVEGVSTAVADRFKWNRRKTTLTVCLVAGVVSLIYVTKAGLAFLDIVDNFTNQYGMIIAGALECIVVGWMFKPKKVLEQINRNTKSYKMPAWWFITAIKYLAPVVLLAFCCWNLSSLFRSGANGIYGAADGYSLLSNLILGWGVLFLSLISGFIVKLIIKAKKKKGFVDDGVTPWED